MVQAQDASDGVIVVDGLGYPIVVTEDLARDLPRVAGAAGAPVALVYDRRVEWRARVASDALAAAGRAFVGELAVDAGERRKNVRGAMGIVQWLAGLRAERSWLLVAVGGGSLTDCAGFAAATYARGIAWLPVATTVLGMVDAAIGGKTGVDLPQGKNLMGAFWDPIGVACDLEAMRTLPRKQRATGMAEIVKAGIIGDAQLFDVIERRGMRALDAATIAAAARVKALVVASDPRESGQRAALNLGHTVGHALEAASKFRMAHGEAVAIGLRAAGLLALREGMWSKGEHARTLRTILKCKLPLEHGLPPAEVMAALAQDKKRIGGELRLALPARIGEVRTGVAVSSERVREIVELCGRPPENSELSDG